MARNFSLPADNTKPSPILQTDGLASEFEDRDHWKLLAFVIFSGPILNIAFRVLTNYHLGRKWASVQLDNIFAVASFFRGGFTTDSLYAMLPAIHFIASHPGASPYQEIFFKEHTKLQYPLASLLPYYILSRLGVSDHALWLISRATGVASVCGIFLLTIWIAFRFLPNEESNARCRRARLIVVVAVGIGVLSFFPLMFSYYLGQIQTPLSFGFTIAFCLWMTKREAAAGAVMGLMTLVKPQYALFGLWVLLRKKFSALVSFIACALAGTLAACLMFGFHHNLEYLGVLKYIGQHGESYVENQSMNGLLQRLIFTGSGLLFDKKSFPVYNPLVYFGTLLSSLALLSFAIFYPWGARRIGKIADFSCFMLAATMASPIAWEHHYAILLPVFVWLWFSQSQHRASRPWLFTIGLAYILVSDHITPLGALESVPVLNILLSQIFFGAILVLFLLVKSLAVEGHPMVNQVHRSPTI